MHMNAEEHGTLPAGQLLETGLVEAADAEVDAEEEVTEEAAVD